MRIAIPKERRDNEPRVAAAPDVVKKLIGLGFQVVVEKGAGAGASFTDKAFEDAGATIAATADAALKAADAVFKIQPPLAGEIAAMKKGAILIAQLGALTDPKGVEAYAKAGLSAFAMELMPRISRAQSMDVLSSQSNLAGYKAVIEAASEFTRAFPMMMTAAGTVAPAKAFVMGVGVAGLQAIATAKRLGAVVTATDVRPATKEQVASLGGKFLEVDPEAEKEAETEGGYAKEMSDDYKKKQAAKVREHIKSQDIVITTALVPGRKAPVLVTEDMVADMKPGSVIVDLAAEAGGNCALTKQGEVVVSKNGVKIVGPANLAGELAQNASALFAKNILNFIMPFVNTETKALAIDWEDELVKGTLVTRGGKVVHPMLSAKKQAPASGGGAATGKPATKAKDKGAGKSKGTGKRKGKGT
jgi:H+-translocating NAD(P) transhydrogenase subunit alpha